MTGYGPVCCCCGAPIRERSEANRTRREHRQSIAIDPTSSWKVPGASSLSFIPKPHVEGHETILLKKMECPFIE
jgi:hypothetical protein